MSISDAILDLSARVQGAFDACEAKGADMPEERTTHTLSACIDTIPAGGSQPSSLTISSSTAYEHYNRYGWRGLGSTQWAYTSAWSTNESLREVTLSASVMGQYGAAYAFAGCPNLSSLNVWTSNGASNYSYQGAFAKCPSLKHVTLPANSMGNYCFSNMFLSSGIETLSVYRPLGAYVQANTNNTYFNAMCGGCASLTAVDFSMYSGVTGSSNTLVFGSTTGHFLNNCHNLRRLTFHNLRYVGTESGAGVKWPCLGAVPISINSNYNLSVYFPDLTRAAAGDAGSSDVGYTSMLGTGTSSGQFLTKVHFFFPKCTYVGKYAFNLTQNCVFHFAAANKATIEALDNYSNNFCNFGYNTLTCVFDL